MYKTHLQIYFVSVPVIFICILGSAYMTIIQFYFEDSLMEKFGADSYIVLLPSIFQSVFVAVLAVFYEKFATWLTLKENHRTQSQYERHRVNKLIVLEFVNNFLCLFYIAFIKMDMKMLRSQLMTQMIVLQVSYLISNFVIINWILWKHLFYYKYILRRMSENFSPFNYSSSKTLRNSWCR